MYLSFSSSYETKFLEKNNCLVYMQILCILATWSEVKVCPTSAFQLVLVSEAKKLPHILSCNFSCHWSNPALYENFGDYFKKPRTNPSYPWNLNISKNFTQKNPKMLTFCGKNYSVSLIHPCLFKPSIWTFMKIKCKELNTPLLTSYTLPWSR